MPGPEMPSASSASEGQHHDQGMVDGRFIRHGLELGEQSEPMPTMTASTSTLTPDDTTLPSTFSARKLVLFQSANGTSTKPASVVSFELDQR